MSDTLEPPAKSGYLRFHDGNEDTQRQHWFEVFHNHLIHALRKPNV